jgi:uncharacterized membrane protein
MDIKRYKQMRVIIILFLGAIIGISVIANSYMLSAITIFIGLLFLVLVRSKTKITIDEREVAVREKAAQLTYAIFAPTIGIGAFLLLFPGNSGLSVFSKGEWIYVESLGMVLAYLTLFLIALYAISYYFLNKKYGGGNDE